MAPFMFRRVPKGDTYTLEEFQFAYSLSDTDAARLYRISGPSRVDLDALMQAKAEKATLAAGSTHSASTRPIPH